MIGPHSYVLFFVALFYGVKFFYLKRNHASAHAGGKLDMGLYIGSMQYAKGMALLFGGICVLTVLFRLTDS